jgi:hypothetical protein
VFLSWRISPINVPELVIIEEKTAELSKDLFTRGRHGKQRAEKEALMKRCKRIREKAIILATLLLLFSCATTQQAQRVKEGETINMDSYTVALPPGENWEIQKAKEKGMVTFLKLKKWLFTGRVLGSTTIKVFRNEIAPQGWHLSEEEIANDFRNNEEKIMREEGVKNGLYELEDVTKSIESEGDKKLYAMSYKITRDLPGGGAAARRAQEAVLYLYFPPDFKVRHIFYGFLISEDYERGSFVKVDLAQIDTVINSFRITSPPVGFPVGMNGEMLRAAAEGNTSNVKDLINKGADVNAKSTNGWTPLMYVSATGNKEIVSLLIAKGANTNEKNNQGQTPLLFAAHWGHAETVNLLLEKGADINAQMDDGWSILTDAIDMNRVEIAKILIAKGADVNLKSKKGWTALMAASLKNHPDIVRLLIEKGADVNAKAEKDTTALKTAVKLGNVEIVRLLKEAGAKE